MSMAAGEYVSVSSQADTEAADIARERAEIAGSPEAELSELTSIYIARGVQPDLARQVAEQMMARDALGSHLRDELGLSEIVNAAPVQAALVSAATFAAGAAAPVIVTALAPAQSIVLWVMTGTLIALAMLGALGAAAGGASRRRGLVRVVFWGVVAMATTAGVGRLFGTVAG
jgi:VIT1/CCC1 family predicted Fe2+/Mn2+ transporter